MPEEIVTYMPFLALQFEGDAHLRGGSRITMPMGPRAFVARNASALPWSTEGVPKVSPRPTKLEGLLA